MLAQRHFRDLTPQLKANLVAFYAQPDGNFVRRDKKKWAKTQKELAQLRQAPPVASQASSR